MAGESNRDLWQFITGRSFLHPKELVGAEIQRNKNKILQGLNFYKAQKTPSGEQLKSTHKLAGRQLDCVLQISKFLGIEEVQTYDIYCSFLIHEYRGSKHELQDVLNTERYLQQFILRVRDYYFTERSYLLQCISHMLGSWQDQNHPYQEEYTDLVRPLYESDKFIKEVITCYKELCNTSAPTWEKHGTLMTERQSSVWLLQNLKEQCGLLEIIFLYYKNVEHSVDSLTDLLQLFKRQSFGRRQLNKHLIDEVMDPIMSRIGFLQVMLLIEGVDLEDLQEKNEGTGSMYDHHLLKSSGFSSLDVIIPSLGDIPPHGPLVLIWAVIHQMAYPDNPKSQAMVRCCGNKALDLKVFQYLNACLQMEPFNGKTMLSSVCHTVIYGLLCAVLHCFDESTLGDTQSLYELASTVVTRNFLAEDFWERGDSDGIGRLLQESSQRFPLDSRPLLTLATALAGASRSSALQMLRYLQRLLMFTEYQHGDSVPDLEPTPEPQHWQTKAQSRPYDAIVGAQSSCELTFPKGIIVRIPPVGDHRIVQWKYPYNGFDVFIGEMEALLHQGQYGAELVQRSTLERVTDCCKLLSALMSVDALLIQEAVAQLWDIIDSCFLILERFSQMSSPPLELIAACINIITEASKLRPKQMWHQMQQTSVLPYLTENLNTLAEICSASGLNAACYGRILAGTECTQGDYPVTIAVLNFIAQLINPLHEQRSEGSLSACVLFVSREIFPVFHKWRYYKAHTREKIGHLCLQIFHRALNLLSPSADQAEITDTYTNDPSLRRICVSSLLFTESGKTLLDIIDTGVDNVETALAQQASAVEGSGIALIDLIRFAFSVLNRLLLLRPDGAPTSPVELWLSATPARSSRHIVATMAQYMYHRHDARLPTLATLLLRRIALVYPMSILACLGNDAEPIRDVYLVRLQATTEDIGLKVGILELLTVCVETQPGLIETFLNLREVIQPPNKKSVSETRRDWSMGKRSCLLTVLGLIEDKKQGGYQCPSELLHAVVEFLHSLWLGRRETAISVLRDRREFWPSLCLSLTRDLQSPLEADSQQEVLNKEIRTVATILRILAHELFALPSNHRPDDTLQQVLDNLMTKNRLQYWVKYLLWSQRAAARLVVHPGDVLSDNPALHMVMGIRNFLLVIAAGKPHGQQLSPEAKNEILTDLLECIDVQFQSQQITELNVKLASITSAAYISLLKHWISSVEDFVALLNKQSAIVHNMCINTETRLPSVLIGVLGAVTHQLQYLKDSDKKAHVLSELKFSPLVELVCILLQQNSKQLDPTEGTSTPAQTETRLKLQVVCVCLMTELATILDGPEHWLGALAQHSVLPSIVTSIHDYMQSGRGLDYVQCVLMLLLTLSHHRDAAETVAVSGITQCLCLYSTKSGEWESCYKTGISLITSLLASLKHGFLQDALQFIGTHQERIVQCMSSVGATMCSHVLTEAVETCKLVYHLSGYRRQWFLHLRPALHHILVALCALVQRAAALLIRPRLLQHVIDKRPSTAVETQAMAASTSASNLLTTPLSRRLPQHSISLSPDVTHIQHRLFDMVAWSVGALNQFSPDLCEILMDQNIDLAEYEPLLTIGFSTPGMEGEMQPSFGTLLAITNMCVRVLSKSEGRSTSPTKHLSPDVCTTHSRPKVQFVLEKSLLLCMSQSVRFLRDPQLSLRDQQLLKRELGTEMNSILVGLNRYFRKTPASPSSASLVSPKTVGSSPSLVSPKSRRSAPINPLALEANVQEAHKFVGLVEAFITQLLR